jgi:hypothetical protein
MLHHGHLLRLAVWRVVNSWTSSYDNSSSNMSGKAHVPLSAAGFLLLSGLLREVFASGRP